MTIQLIDGNILIRDGSVATHEDCCCTPSCLPDVCVSPSSSNCKNCWESTCNGGSCLEWQTIEVAIDGVGDVVTIPSIIPSGSCRTGFDCNCEVFNSSFIHNFASGCSTLWTVREASPPFLLFDTCGTPQTGACNLWQITRQVFVRVAVANKQVSYTTGTKSSITFPNAYTIADSGWGNGLYVCNNYTIQPGHYVIVELLMTGRVGGVGGNTLYYNKKIFLYSFGNGAKVDVGCGDDQYYPTCGPYIGGDATLVVSSRYTRATVSSNPVYYADCNDIDELCQLGSATVTVEPPVVELCEVTPPPPPPP